MTVDDRTGHRCLSLATMLVRDYDEAIAFCVGKLGFELREDTRLADGKRWVVVGPPRGDASLLLARAIGEQDANRSLCKQFGGFEDWAFDTSNRPTA